MNTSEVSLEKVWELFNEYVNNELMFDSPAEEILGFPEWTEAHYGIPKDQSEQWFYQYADQGTA